jgi:hypothetical protein
VDSEPTLCTPAWLLRGLIGSEPGLLRLEERRISFTTEATCLFDAPLSDLRRVIFPWYYFGGGMKLMIGANRYRVSFVRPNNQEVPWARLLGRLQLPPTKADSLIFAEARAKVGDMRSARRAGTQWKRALQGGSRLG